MKTIFNVLDKRRSGFIFGVFVFIVLVIVSSAIAVDNIVYFSPFFVLPVVFVSWYGSARSGITLAVFSAAALVISRQGMNVTNFNIESAVYDGLSHVIAYVILAILITNFRKVHGFEVIAADTDNLTGLLSPRAFNFDLANELHRSFRYKRVFSLAYLDIDNFKLINDTQGHTVGNKVLIAVAKCLTASMRANDSIARLGGDEFGCLLPETNQEEAKQAFLKAKKRLNKCVDNYNCQITFSIGIVTFTEMPIDIEEALNIADELMYSVKHNKKNNIAFQLWHDKS